MRNIFKLFLFTLILICKSNQISVNELWEIREQKIKEEYKDKSYFLLTQKIKFQKMKKKK